MKTATSERRKFEAGDILVCLWGYEQTNVSYYKVVRRTPKFLVLVEIGKTVVEGEVFMTGTCTPNPEVELGKPFRRKVYSNDRNDPFYAPGEEIGVEISSYEWARRWDGRANGWTAYG